MRYVLEGEWTGYVSSQQRVVHREVVTKRRADNLKKLHKIVYTDGTSLLVRVREAEYREKVREVHSYDALIRKAEKSGLEVYHV